MHLSHLLYFVEIHNKTSLVGMVLLDALSAEYCEVVGAIEMLHPLIVLLTQEEIDDFFVFEVDVPQDTVSLHDLVKDVEVERQLVYGFNLFDEFPTNRTPHPMVMVELGEALSAEGVSAVDQDPGDTLTHIELLAAEIAVVQAPSHVVGLDKVLGALCVFGLLKLNQLIFSYFLKSSFWLSIESILPHLFKFKN